MADYDPRIVELYDCDNGDGEDHHFFRQLAESLQARSILDLGCGTGLLTVSLATAGRTVVGIDPSLNMIRYARARPGGQRVRWICGDSRDIPADVGFDYVVMTGNVVQHITDPDWSRTLADVHRSLRSGGTVAFESRDPAARAWEGWATPTPTVRATAHGPLREWMEISQERPGEVMLIAHNIFESTGEEVIERETLVFRDRSLLVGQLEAAGFTVSGVWPDWNRSEWSGDSSIMVFQATKA
jgi:SAM-dependent methyltransferase